MPDRLFALYEGDALIEDRLSSLAWAEHVAEIRDVKRGVTVTWKRTFGGSSHGKRSDGALDWLVEKMPAE